MTGSELLTQIYYAYRGKGASRVPAWSDEKAQTAIAIANRKKNEWATDANNRWASCFEVRDIADPISTSTFTYDLDTDFFAPSDYALVERTDGTLIEYPITIPQRRNTFNQSLYISGRNPKKVSFAQTIDAGLAGGTLKIPGYYLPPDITSESDEVTIDSPEWLVYITASELARNDAAKDDQYVNLVNQANDLYRKMVDNNNGGAYLQTMTVTNNMPQVGGLGDDDWLD